MVLPPSAPHPSAWRDLPVGARVVVRRRLDPAEAAEAGHVWTDVIGIVLGVDDGGLRLRPDPARRRRGPDDPDEATGAAGAAGATEVVVPAHAIEAAKPVPPRPERRRARDGGSPLRSTDD